ncbi:thioredoxin-like protein [Hymenopellis radicata]|nr:thioredoxin-like protein [Hymenopellis radicata]
MVLQLFGSPVSTCTKRVAVVLREKKVPFELHPINLASREQKSPEYLAKQPFGQVPYIVDDGFVLYESRAICRYIAAKYAHQGTPLLPSSSDLKTIALFEQAASIEQNSFEPYASKCGMEKVIFPRLGLTTNQEAYDQAHQTLDMKLAVYDQILGKQKYLAGDELTIVDLFHISWGVLLKAGGSDIMESKPNLARQVWWIEITSRPAWVAVKDGVQSVEKY